MARRTTPIIGGNYYHVYNRGNQRERIFFERENYLYFLRKFRQYFDQTVSLICYCLMPNHFHFLVHVLKNDFSRRMQNFSNSYAKSINKKYNRVGHLFQGNFKAKLITDDAVLLHLSRYIHLNPVFAKLVQTAEEWEFSSYREYVQMRNGTLPKPEGILEQFKDRQGYKEFVESYQEEHFEMIKEYVLEN
ncbi:MAG: transposase [bacterium]